MMFCQKCGKELPDDAKFCPGCGATTDAQTQKTESAFEKQVDAFTDTPDTTAGFMPDDIAQNKGYAVLAYLGALVLIPLFAAKNSKFARFHTNQGLVLFVATVVWNVVTRILTAVLKYLYVTKAIVSGAMWLIGMLLCVLAIMGIVNAVKGRAKELPLIGKIRFLHD